MAQTIDQGYVLPDETDSNDRVLSIIRENTARLATHNHDGTNSVALSAGDGGAGGVISDHYSLPNWDTSSQAEGVVTFDRATPTGVNLDPVGDSPGISLFTGSVPVFCDIQVLGPQEIRVISSVTFNNVRIVYS